MIDLMTRLKIHHMAEGGTPQADIAERCGVGLRSVERIVTEPVPTRAEILADAREGASRLGRPPKADEAMVERLRLLLKDEPKISAIEVLRRAKGWGYAGGRSQLSALVKKLRPKPTKESVVRFDGLPGEYTQSDFGECQIHFKKTGPIRVQFFAARLKFSRFMFVKFVSDQTAETVVGSVLSSLVAFGGSTKEWVSTGRRTEPDDDPELADRRSTFGPPSIPGPGGRREQRDRHALHAREGPAEGERRAPRGLREEQLPPPALVRGHGGPRGAAHGLAARGQPRPAERRDGADPGGARTCCRCCTVGGRSPPSVASACWSWANRPGCSWAPWSTPVRTVSGRSPAMTCTSCSVHTAMPP